MFEHEGMTDAALSLPSSASAGEEIRALQSRITQMQATKLDTRAVRTHPAIAPLLPGGSLRAGAAYSVESSTALVMALMAGPSADGVWCGVVGMPDFGVEAAARFGVDLERLALVPNPGDEWLQVTAAMADVVGVVVTRVPGRVPDAAVARLQARIRQRDATLIVLGEWPQSEATLRITESSWTGIGSGHGYLAGRQAMVSVTARTGSGRPRRGRLWLPDGDELFRPVIDLPGMAAVPPLRSAGAGAGVGAGAVGARAGAAEAERSDATGGAVPLRLLHEVSG